MNKIFLICPVRNATDEQKQKMEAHIKNLEDRGHQVYYPARDTDQNDPIGYTICVTNANAIEEADAVHIFWDKNSTGSLFDLGVAFALKKSVVIVNIDDLEPTEGKSFTNMLMYWNMI